MKVVVGLDRQSGLDPYGQTWSQQWALYADNHPDVLASWSYSNDRWANCTCPDCDPHGRIAASLPGEPIIDIPKAEREMRKANVDCVVCRPDLHALCATVRGHFRCEAHR